jgi:hypothetical protein
LEEEQTTKWLKEEEQTTQWLKEEEQTTQWLKESACLPIRLIGCYVFKPN